MSFSVLFLLLPVEVALIVEVTEEDDEGDAITKHHHVERVREITLCEQVVARVKEEQTELHLVDEGREGHTGLIHAGRVYIGYS